MPGEVIALYKHFDKKGVLLYVGVTKNPKKRNYTHLSSSFWCRHIDHIKIVEWYPDFASAHIAEKEAIRTELPIFNSRYAPPGAGERMLAYLNANRARIARLPEQRGPISLRLIAMRSILGS